MATIGDRQIRLADDYAAALDALATRATENTTAALAKAMATTLRELRRYYRQAIDPELEAELSADGVLRRPGAYSIADRSAKFQKLIRLAQGFMPPKALAALQEQFLLDFEQAVTLGGELGQELARTANPDAEARGLFVGASRAAVQAAAATASAYIRGEVESFRDSIARIVTDGVGRGVSGQAIEKDIRKALLGAKDPQGLNNRMGLKQRAELIARSELANAYVGAQKASAARNGYAYGRWIAAKDERTCRLCASRHGRIYRLDQMVGSLHPRCRCALSPVATEAVEEPDPELRAKLLRTEFWDKAREEVTAAFAKGQGWPLERAGKVLEAAVLKPAPSERRQYPDIDRAPSPVA